MTIIICELVVIPLAVGCVSGLLSTYIIRFFDKRKNDRRVK